MFADSSGVQINGGLFYNVAGDVNVQSIQPPGNEDEALMAFQLGLTEGSSRQLAGVQRSGRHGSQMKNLPYGMCNHSE
jgi:hypothetical protein